MDGGFRGVKGIEISADGASLRRWYLWFKIEALRREREAPKHPLKTAVSFVAEISFAKWVQV